MLLIKQIYLIALSLSIISRYNMTFYFEIKMIFNNCTSESLRVLKWYRSMVYTYNTSTIYLKFIIQKFIRVHAKTVISMIFQ